MTEEDSKPLGRMIYSDVTMSINQRQFHDTPPVYVTFPHVSFDGFNIHLLFLSGTPNPLDDPTDEDNSVRVTARLVMPYVVADATMRALDTALNNLQPSGILARTISESNVEEVEETDG